MPIKLVYEVCHQFLNLLNPAFLKLAKRINEIINEMNNFKIFEQITASENKINDKYKESISRYEMVREDSIFMFAKYDNENKVLMIEFEDGITDGLIVLKHLLLIEKINNKEGFISKMLVELLINIKVFKMKQ